MSIDDNKMLAHRILAASTNSDVAFLERIVAQDYVQHAPGVPPTRAAFFAFARFFNSAFPDGRFHVEDMIGEDDKVLIRWVFEGTHLGAWMGRPASGKHVKFVGMDLWRFADGKFVESWFITDTMGMLRQLGHLPALQFAPAGERRD